MNIVNLSGGKDSTAMLLMMLERTIPIDKVVFVDTGKEFPEMYRHIAELERRTGIIIDKLTVDFDYWFYKHVKTRGKAKGEAGYGFPTWQIRWCTALKIQAIHRYSKLVSDPVHYVGIAHDEQHRIKEGKQYPLIDWEVTEAQALSYCYDRGYTWEGLYDNLSRVSCFCCPLKRMDEYRYLYHKRPELWSELEYMQERSKIKFLKNYTVDELAAKFRKESN